MTRIYEALQKAGRERQEQPGRPVPKPLPGKPLPLSLETKLLALYSRIETLLDGVPGGHVVEFTGVHPTDDCSKLVYEFARLVAYRRNKRVLLLGAGPFPFVRHEFSGRADGEEFQKASGQESDVPGEAEPVSATEAEVAQSLVKTPPSSVPVAGAFRLDDSMGGYRDRYDLVLIDAPPADGVPDGVTLTHLVDGVVLVVEAEKSRWQVVQSIVDEIRSRGGRFLGIVLNKRKYYVPGFLYRRLL
jgi:hypothetical protein